MTEIIHIAPGEGDHPGIGKAAAILRAGGLVAFPTETVYGLGANGLDAAAVRRIFIAKGRPADNPLILHVASPAEAGALTTAMPPAAGELARRFWPGPLTMVLPRSPAVPEIVSAGLPTVAIRVPAHPVALMLIRAAGIPVAAPSANTSGRPSPTSAGHVLDDLRDRVELILDGGPARIGLESTVVDMTGPVPRLLRPGGVTVEELREALGPAGLALDGADPERPAAPGMKYRHYAPRAPLTLVLGEPGEVTSRIAAELAAARGAGRRLAALVHSESLPDLSGLGLVMDLGPRGRPEVAGERLFSLLRACDEAAVEGILAEGEDEEGMGRAVMNRLLKAAGGRIMLAGGAKR